AGGGERPADRGEVRLEDAGVPHAPAGDARPFDDLGRMSVVSGTRPAGSRAPSVRRCATGDADPCHCGATTTVGIPSPRRLSACFGLVAAALWVRGQPGRCPAGRAGGSFSSLAGPCAAGAVPAPSGCCRWGTAAGGRGAWAPSGRTREAGDHSRPGVTGAAGRGVAPRRDRP